MREAAISGAARRLPVEERASYLNGACAGDALLRREIAQQGQEAKRTGIFTTAVMAEVGDHRVALYFTGSEHAGENLDRLLQQRAEGLEAPIHMCDALSRNQSKAFDIIESNCLTQYGIPEISCTGSPRMRRAVAEATWLAA